MRKYIHISLCFGAFLVVFVNLAYTNICSYNVILNLLKYS